jgi:hypothetical protein
MIENNPVLLMKLWPFREGRLWPQGRAASIVIGSMLSPPSLAWAHRVANNSQSSTATVDNFVGNPGQPPRKPRKFSLRIRLLKS